MAGVVALFFVTSISAQQRNEPAFFRDAWNVKSRPAAPRLALNAAMVPAAVLPAAIESIPEAIDAIQQWNDSGHEPMRNGFMRTLPDTIDFRMTGRVASKTASAFARGVMAQSDRSTTIWSTMVEVQKSYRLRLHLENVSLPAGAVLWIYGTSDQPIGFGSELMAAGGSLWTPSVSGPIAYLELEIPTGSQVSFSIHEVLELVDPKLLGVPKPNDAPTCLLDASCIASSQFDQIANDRLAIALLEFVTSDGSYSCSGSLITDRAHTGAPYLLTANHCFSDQTVASTLEAFFDYRTSSCNGSAPSLSSLLRVNGSQFLAGSATSDFTFVQLNSRPSGRSLLGWAPSASSIQLGVKLHRISHPHPVPAGPIYPQQYSMTNVNTGVPTCKGPNGNAARPQFIYSSTVFGGTYGGSSGSAALLDGGYIVGQLLGGCPTGGSDASDGCDTRNSEVDGAFSNTYTYISSWLEVATPTVCTANATTLCLSGNRFAVTAQWRTADGQSGQGQVVPLTSDTGYFWFFQATNVEAVVKVLNACALGSPRFWVFAGGLTNVGVTITVIDTKNGTVKNYVNPQGTAFVPVQDTNAFATCP